MSSVEGVRWKDTPQGKAWKKYRWKRDYGVTPEWFEQKLKEQNGKCAICRLPPRHGRELGIDHCHATNRARGLLCEECNYGLGSFHDNPTWLRAAADYLEADYG